MIVKVKTVFEGSVESLGNSNYNQYVLTNCNIPIDKTWSASLNGYEGRCSSGTSAIFFTGVPYPQSLSKQYKITCEDGKLIFHDPSQVDPGFVYNIVVKKTVLLPDPDYTRSSDLAGALKYFYQEILLNGNVPQEAINEMFADAHSVLDVVRMYYRFRYSSLPVKAFEAKNLTEFFNNMGDMVSNTGSGDSGSGRGGKVL